MSLGAFYICPNCQDKSGELDLTLKKVYPFSAPPLFRSLASYAKLG